MPAPWKFDIFKTSKGKHLFEEHQISAGQQSADISLTETDTVLIKSSNSSYHDQLFIHFHYNII